MSTFGSLLRHRRSQRGPGQRDLAALRVPARERNALLHAAGFAPVRRTLDLDDAIAGAVGRKRVLDSTPLYDAVATQDTVTMIRSAIRGLLRVAPESHCRRQESHGRRPRRDRFRPPTP